MGAVLCTKKPPALFYNNSAPTEDDKPCQSPDSDPGYIFSPYASRRVSSPLLTWTVWSPEVPWNHSEIISPVEGEERWHWHILGSTLRSINYTR